MATTKSAKNGKNSLASISLGRSADPKDISLKGSYPLRNINSRTNWLNLGSSLNTHLLPIYIYLLSIPDITWTDGRGLEKKKILSLFSYGIFITTFIWDKRQDDQLFYSRTLPVITIFNVDYYIAIHQNPTGQHPSTGVPAIYR